MVSMSKIELKTCVYPSNVRALKQTVQHYFPILKSGKNSLFLQCKTHKQERQYKDLTSKVFFFLKIPLYLKLGLTWVSSINKTAVQVTYVINHKCTAFVPADPVKCHSKSDQKRF